MQAITIGIGKNGIDFFAQKYLVNTLITLFKRLTPPNRTIPVPDFSYAGWEFKKACSNISVVLSGGSLDGFAPNYQSITQGVSGDANKTPIFTLVFGAKAFTAHYNWTENYHWEEDDTLSGPNGPIVVHRRGDTSTPFNYAPGFDGLTASVTVRFLFDSRNDKWEIAVFDTSADSHVSNSNIPADSVLQHQDVSCASSHIDAATEQAVDNIDFASPLNSLITGMIASIPGSGNLGDGIVYDFSLGDSGLSFPDSDGIQMGVRGGASFNGTAFSGATPPVLPLPTPPADADAHHLNMYVSSYEIDALYWAYYKAGKLDVVVSPTDLQDPKILKVATYVSTEPALKPFQAFAMQARVSPSAAPVSSFQAVWVLNAQAMNVLQKQLPPNVYQLLEGLQGNAYASQSSLEDDLTGATIPSSWFGAIEQAAKSMGNVINSTLNFDLIIQNQQPAPPDIKFSVTRTDILSNLRLGTGANKTQTMQYDFTNVTFSTKFISSTVPKFIGGDFFSDVVWQQAGEPGYEKALADMGKTGVPLPIMKDFQFDFTSAELSVQENYISIEANVTYKTQ